jgi:hypothetical protein
MKRLILTQPVGLYGPGYFGHLGKRGKIAFMPADNFGEWTWQIDRKRFLQINPRIVDTSTRRLRLIDSEGGSDKKFEVYEHTGALRFTGLGNVLVSSSKWPPCFGRTIEQWQALKPACRETSRDLSWYTPKRSFSWVYPRKRNGSVGFTEIHPSAEPKLSLEITCTYPGVGELVQDFTFPNLKLLEEIFAVHTQGWPRKLYWPARVGALLGIPLYRTSNWPQEHASEDLIRLYIYHRALDLLGALSLLCLDGMFAGRVVSHCSGHEADLHVVKAAFPFLRQL